jgi:hypothetical protein
MLMTNDVIKSILTENFNCQTSAGGLNTHAIFESDEGDEISIRIIRVAAETAREKVGIHIHSLETLEELQYQLVDAVETCLKDNYPTIYIHGSL